MSLLKRKKPETITTEGNPNVVGAVVSSKRTFPKPNLPGFLVARKKLSIALLVVVILVGIGLAKYIQHQRATTKIVPVADVCPGPLLFAASRSLEINQVEKLKPTADLILAKNNYDKDPNCLYVLAVYYINAADLQNAQTTIEKLEKVYNPTQGFSPQIKAPSHLKTFENLKEQVAFLGLLSEAAKKNATFGPAP